MGFYYNKLMAMQEETSVEKAVEDGIQTPNDVGVDLNHVEDVIAGDEGIESHKEEIEDAMEGIVGDPLDECMIIMYESEYNFNQLMKCIGIEELNEFAQGRDFVLEGGNLKAFIENAKKILKGMWEKAKAIFNAAIDKIEQMVNVNKALAKANEAKIKEGFEKGNWKITDAYDFDKMNIEYAPKHTAIIDMVNSGTTLPNNSDLVFHVSGIQGVAEQTASRDMIVALKEKHLVKREYTPNDSGILNIVLDIMKSDKATVELRKIYRAIESEYDTLIKDMDRIESELNDDKKDKVSEVVKLVQYEKNLQHNLFAVCTDLHKRRASQARKFAMVWLKAVNDNKVTKDQLRDMGIEPFEYEKFEYEKFKP